MHKKRQPRKDELQTGRELAVYVLTRVEINQSYSNLELNRALNAYKPEKKEAALATELVYGTLSKLNTLDWMIDRYVKLGVGKLDDWVRQLLRISFYQIQYLDKIPDRAAVHEAVEIAKKKGHKGISGFVNGVLRQWQRQPEKVKIPQQWPLYKRMALETSFPEWMIQRWMKVYGEETTRRMAQALNQPPHVSIRVNRLKTTVDQLEAELRQAFPKVDMKRSPFAPEGILLSQVGNIAHSPFYKDGLCTIQDESSMLVAHAAAPMPGMDILDACAAPGGKATHMAEMMDNRGKITAVDIHEHKKKFVEENAQRLGVQIIETFAADAAKISEDSELNGRLFDVVLVDAPCTGLGVIRRKPDLKWYKREEDRESISNLQLQILQEVAPLVKPQGILVYSTCTIDPAENEELVQRFIDGNPSFIPDPDLEKSMPEAVREFYKPSQGTLQILPHHFGSDGFFIARPKKVHSPE